jgi:hypothetical protein
MKRRAILNFMGEPEWFITNDGLQLLRSCAPVVIEITEGATFDPTQAAKAAVAAARRKIPTGPLTLGGWLEEVVL